MTPSLSVVIPAYNESKNFRDGLLEPAVAYLSQQKYTWEVIFVNDGSTDDTQNLLQGFCQKHSGYKVMTIPHGGKAAAVTTGVLAATGKIILFTDFDQSTPLRMVDKFLAAHGQGYQVAVGDRGGMGKMDNTLFRRFRSWAFVTIVQVILLPGIHDSQCGFKSFQNTAAKKIFSQLLVTNTGKVTGGYMGAFDVEALFLAKKFGFKIVQIPVEWQKVEGTRLNPITEPLKMLRDVFKVRFFDIFGR